MRDLRKYIEPALKTVCLALAILVLWDLVAMARCWSPFHGVKVPELPALTANTNTSSSAANPGMASVKGPSSKPATPNTNAASSATNRPAAVAVVSTNSAVLTNVAMASTNAPAVATTNADAHAIAHGEASAMTNAIATTTNIVAATNAVTAKTNIVAASIPAAPRPESHHSAGPPQMAGMGFNPFGGGGPGNSGADISPAMKARIGKIVDSEILGPVFHPLPMALLGIAGNVAFIRSANGQTGMVKEGDSLDDLKLLKIGINRILVEQAGEKKELTIFAGFGSDSLLSNNSTNENNHP